MVIASIRSHPQHCTNLHILYFKSSDNTISDNTGDTSSTIRTNPQTNRTTHMYPHPTYPFSIFSIVRRCFGVQQLHGHHSRIRVLQHRVFHVFHRTVLAPQPNVFPPRKAGVTHQTKHQLFLLFCRFVDATVFHSYGVVPTQLGREMGVAVFYPVVVVLFLQAFLQRLQPLPREPGFLPLCPVDFVGFKQCPFCRACLSGRREQ